MNSNNSSTKKGVNRAQKANGNGNKSRSTANNKRANNSGQQSKRGAGKQVAAAQSFSTQQVGKAPRISMNEKSCRVVHRELIRNVLSQNATGAYVVNEQVSLNPGLSSFVPWLAKIAKNWESYRFHKLRFCYYTRTGTTTVGSVILAPDYDASDAQPSSEQIASSYQDVVEDAPWKDMVVTLQPKSMHSVGPHKFVRGGNLLANQDIKLYDVGNLFICTVDSTAVAAWGKIWVEYDCEFFTPQLQSDGQSEGSEKQTSVAGNTAAKPFGTTQPVVLTSGEPIVQWSDVGAGTFTLLRDYEGIFKMTFVGTVITAVALAGGTSTTSNLSRLFDGAGGLTAEYTSTFSGIKGQTFVGPTLTATTVTSAIVRISSYDVSQLS